MSKYVGTELHVDLKQRAEFRAHARLMSSQFANAEPLVVYLSRPFPWVLRPDEKTSAQLWCNKHLIFYPLPDGRSRSSIAKSMRDASNAGIPYLLGKTAVLICNAVKAAQASVTQLPHLSISEALSNHLSQQPRCFPEFYLISQLTARARSIGFDWHAFAADMQRIRRIVCHVLPASRRNLPQDVRRMIGQAIWSTRYCADWLLTPATVVSKKQKK